MTTDQTATDQTARKASKKPLLIGLVLALLGGGGGFFAVNTGLFGENEDSASAQNSGTAQVSEEVPSFSFVAIEPLIISMPGTNGRDHLRFSAQLEVEPDYAAHVESVKPRIVDVLNGYLRAVDLQELEDPAALMRLRSQMLRRIQVVTGPGHVKDLLIMEFVLS